MGFPSPALGRKAGVAEEGGGLGLTSGTILC